MDVSWIRVTIVQGQFNLVLSPHDHIPEYLWLALGPQILSWVRETQH